MKNRFALLIRLGNQTGTLLLLLPSLWALVLATGGIPDFSLLAVFTLGAFFMRSAGVVMNDLADRSIDQFVERTKHRPLASGALSSREAIITAGVFLLLSVCLLVFLPPLPIALSPIAFLLAAVYPYSKRILHMPQAVLGVAFGWGAVMAWASVRHQLEGITWLVFFATVFWAVAYDTIYALQDREDDLRIGVKSTAVLFGAYTWLGIGLASLLMVFSLGLAGWMAGLNPVFYGVLVGVGLWMTRQIARIRQGIGPEEASTMFKQHVLIGIAILCGIFGGTL